MGNLQHKSRGLRREYHVEVFFWVFLHLKLENKCLQAARLELYEHHEMTLGQQASSNLAVSIFQGQDQRLLEQYLDFELKSVAGYSKSIVLVLKLHRKILRDM